MKWEYIRIKDAKCSKWVSGNNWVTKYDAQPYCVIGINGTRIHGFIIKSPKEARKAVEYFLSNPKQ